MKRYDLDRSVWRQLPGFDLFNIVPGRRDRTLIHRLKPDLPLVSGSFRVEEMLVEMEVRDEAS